mmetsp:Transcript_16679/g.16110  ORF Transcript_16679/g.16110 Transcript_16679/m.16110 type:complete len:510 (-) Transcript_16679:47-1576(-)|eukprot:CAMPEP_0197837352 /NCGR_PEP_ID=MMETSP1437-20131217/31911_1 /TAXON_ID=49252 ORGANISM="Eucampia antarctica, Strain CCMP1452" /NCGR_SAMPLE_ID=MMETSP1437 /ASSEMBLY_ACC=CAM_ASM_001096 /LENGTH=509 /DNA_ID=CAMNT_0043444339 /DNA_START=42 /DNA_END=1571 /DNA_ORIENTATION=+
MGKKSKRVRSSKPNNVSSVDEEESRRSAVAPSVRGPRDAENVDSLLFEDPFGDEFEAEEVYDPEGEETKDDNNDAKESADSNEDKIVAWNPFASNSGDEPLEMDESAYKMHHALTPEWPSLSFDFIRDTLGSTHRTRFPHSFIAAIGTQADRPEKNKLTVLKLSDLGRVKKNNEKDDDDDEWEEYDKDNESDDEDGVDMDPVMEHFSIPHNGGVNRVRCMPQNNSIVATWSDTGKVNIYNVESIVQALEGAGGTNKTFPKSPFFTYSHHPVEGFAMDWSPNAEGKLATGDCDGNIHIWNPTELLAQKEWTTSTWNVNAAYSNINSSVEDLQWSPTEATVLASAECGGGYIKIYDSRRHGKAMLSQHISAPTNVDINVVAWNALVPNLLASGSDDGTFCVWDLRTFSSSSSPVKPLARFACHKKPITSLEWHPTDESMIVVSDEDGTYIYDLSIEQEDGQEKEVDGIPAQLLFVHSGSTITKEVHWHPQISSCVMTTAFSGFSTFIPSNL